MAYACLSEYLVFMIALTPTISGLCDKQDNPLKLCRVYFGGFLGEGKVVVGQFILDWGEGYNTKSLRWDFNYKQKRRTQMNGIKKIKRKNKCQLLIRYTQDFLQKRTRIAISSYSRIGTATISSSRNSTFNKTAWRSYEGSRY